MKEYARADSACGYRNELAMVWLLPEEVDAYETGQRIIDGPNNFVRERAIMQRCEPCPMKRIKQKMNCKKLPWIVKIFP